MRAVSTAAGLMLAVCLSMPVGAAQNSPSSAQPAQAQTKKKAVQPAKPSWEQCYAMSRQRGFDHELDEWLQSIQDCQDGKIPL